MRLKRKREAATSDTLISSDKMKDDVVRACSVSSMGFYLFILHKLTDQNSDLNITGAEKLEYLDMSNNYFDIFPSIALKSLTSLKHLNLSSNMISVRKIDIILELHIWVTQVGVKSSKMRVSVDSLGTHMVFFFFFLFFLI